MTNRRPIRAASAAGARGRTTSLSPPHLGEATAAATLVVIVGGIALVVTGIGVIVTTLTLGARYAGDPPPDIASHMIAPTIGGILVLVLGAALAVGGVAVLGDARRARVVTGSLAAVAAAFAALLVIPVMSNAPAAPVAAIALTITALVFGVAAILLLRPRR